MKPLFRTSVTRRLPAGPLGVDPVPRDRWQLADTVVAEIVNAHGGRLRFETPGGRMVELLDGDRVVGALGDREATLEATGSWREIGEDGRLHALTGGGLLGRLTSKSPLLPELVELRYLGHATHAGARLNLADHRIRATGALAVPVVLVVGSSMSAGKTATARRAVHELTSAGLRVAACKLTGAARYRDVLSMADAGAARVHDFVDAGLPSTVVDRARFEEVTRDLLPALADGADVLVVEAGASPLEPYNGDVVLELLRPHLAALILCASDPYAVVGIASAFDLRPDLVGGPACNTHAGAALVRRLTGFEPFSLFDDAGVATLRARLLAAIGRP